MDCGRDFSHFQLFKSTIKLSFYEELLKMENWQVYKDSSDDMMTYFRKNCSGLWAVIERQDGMKLLYKLENWQYNFTGFKASGFNEIESYITNHNKNDIL